MSALTHTLLKRGMELHSTMDDKNIGFKITDVAGMILVVTGIVFVATMFTIEYTFGRVIPTLVMIESPSETISFDPIPTEDNDSLTKDPELQRGNAPKYITASLRRSAKLLGLRGRFRGFSVFVVNAIVVQWIAGILGIMPILRILPMGSTVVIASVLCAQLPLAWTHIVISQPSPKMWFRRLPSMKMWKKVAGPTAVFALCEQLSVMLPVRLAISAGTPQWADNFPQMTPLEQKMVILKSIGILVLGVVLSFLLVIPASVTLTRVQASLLNDTEETIVPFDRSFGGKVIPEIVGGSGVIGLLEAWKTFDWAARIRLIKTYAKVMLLQFGVMVLFALIVVIELLAIKVFVKGPNNPTKVPAHGHN